jgi:hypothetical protein
MMLCLSYKMKQIFVIQPTIICTTKKSTKKRLLKRTKFLVVLRTLPEMRAPLVITRMKPITLKVFSMKRGRAVEDQTLLIIHSELNNQAANLQVGPRPSRRRIKSLNETRAH